jgi:hypothetical protein
MNRRDDLERLLPSYFERRVPVPPEGLLDDLLGETAGLPQRRRRFAMAGVSGWAMVAGIAVVLLIVTVSLKTLLPAAFMGPGSPASPSVSPPEALTTFTVPVPVREKAIADRAATVFEDRLRALGIGNFSGSIGDEMQFSMSIPPSVDPTDIETVLHRVGEVEWLAWPDDLPGPSEGDPVPEGVLPLFDASDQIESVALRAASGDQPSGVEIHFGSVASHALEIYTSSHVGRPMPLAMDGRILISPMIQSPIPAGELLITVPAADAPISPAALAAILESGPLPTGWTVD